MADTGIKSHWGFRSFDISGDATHRLAVNTGNGNLVVTTSDFTFPARVPAILMRTYNSGLVPLIGPPLANWLAKPGSPWRFSFEEGLLGGPTTNVTYVDTTGAVFTWTYNSGTSSFDRPTGVFTDLTYSSGADEYTLTQPNGFLRVFYGPGSPRAGLLKRYEDHNGNKLLFDDRHATTFKLQSIQAESVNGTVTLIDTFQMIGTSSNILQIGLSTVGTSGLYWEYEFDVATKTQLLSVTDPEGQKWSYGYNATTKLLESITDPRGNVAGTPYSTAISYDTATPKRVDQITDTATPTANTIDFAYNTLTTTIETTVTDRRGNDTIMTHDLTADLSLLTVGQVYDPTPPTPVIYTTTFTWNSDLLLASLDDANGHTTAYTYDSNGNLLTITDENSEVTTLAYFSNNTLHTIETPLLLTTEFAYDTVTQRNLRTIIRPLGDAIRFEYNTAGDLYVSADGENNIIEFTFNDLYGFKTSTRRKLVEGGETRWLTSTYNIAEPGLYFLGWTNPSGVVQLLATDSIGRTLSETYFPTSGPGISWHYAYDECGNLTSVTDPLTNVTSYEYNQLGLLINEKLPETTGTYSAEFDYDAEENLISVERYKASSSSVITSYTYDTLNRLEKITLPAATSVPAIASEYTYTYDPVGNLLSATDPNGNTTSYTYTALDQLEFESGPVPDLEFKYEYDVDGRLTALIGQPGNLPSGYSERTYAYAYDDNSRLISVTSPDVGSETFVTEYTYFRNDQLKSIRNPKQVAEGGPANRQYTYDTVGRLKTVTDATGATASYNYRDDDLLFQAIDAEARVTTYSYDLAGRLTRIDEPLGSFIKYTLDDNGNVTALEGPDDFHSAYSYDGRNRLTALQRIKVATPTSFVYATTYEYDGLNRIVSITDPRQRKDTFTYDDQSRLTQTVQDVDQSPYVGFKYEFNYTYDPKGRLVEQEHPDGGTIGYGYDEADRVLTIEDEDSNVLTLEYDLWGNLVKRIWPDNAVEEYEFDELDRLTLQKNNLEEEVAFEYDRNGNNIRILSPFGSESRFGYNERDEIMLALLKPANADGPQQLETFAYTPNGRLRVYVGPGQESWTFNYDQLGRWTAAISSLGTKSTREYNPTNTLARTTDFKGLSFSMTYDAMRLRTQTVAEAQGTPNATDYEWEYIDLKEVTEPDGRVTTFTRDRFGRITSYTLDDGTTTYTTDYQYNWRGQVTERTLSGSVNVEGYTYDLRGLITQITYTNPTSSVDMSYDVRGRQTSVSYSNGVTRGFGYNRVGRMIWDAVTDSAGNKFETYYSFDGAGNRVSYIHERKTPITSTLPAVIPEDLQGNPIIVTGDGIFVPGSGGGGQWTYPAYSKGYGVSSLVVNTATIPAFTQNMQASVSGTPISGTTTLAQSGGNTTITQPNPLGGTPYSFNLSGLHSILPAVYTGTSTLFDDHVDLDALGRVKQETLLQVGTATQIAIYDDGETCCGESSIDQLGGGKLMGEKRGRGGVPEVMTANSALLSGPIGPVNKLTSPLADIMGTGGGSPQLTIAYVPKELTGDPEKIFENGAIGELIRSTQDPRTGRATQLDHEDSSGTTNLANFRYDSYGQLIGSSGGGGADYAYNNDWLTGQAQLQRDTSGGSGILGATGKAFNHFSGHTRTTIAVLPSGYEEGWYLRGPQGQVQYNVDKDGEVQSAFFFASQGNRIGQQDYAGPQPLPAYYDKDLAPVGTMPNTTVGAGTMQERTPLAGGMDDQPPAGTAADGASGNPDLGQWVPIEGGSWKDLIKTGPMGDNAPNGLPGMAYPPSDWHKPGSPGDLAPVGAPQTQHGAEGQADRRLSGAWGAQDFYGPKPGGQTGSDLIDDNRDYSNPIGGRSIVGKVSGPPWYKPPTTLPAYPDPRWFGPGPDWGPDPQLPNDKEDKGKGNGEKKNKGSRTSKEEEDKKKDGKEPEGAAPEHGKAEEGEKKPDELTEDEKKAREEYEEKRRKRQGRIPDEELSDDPKKRAEQEAWNEAWDKDPRHSGVVEYAPWYAAPELWVAGAVGGKLGGLLGGGGRGATTSTVGGKAGQLTDDIGSASTKGSAKEIGKHLDDAGSQGTKNVKNSGAAPKPPKTKGLEKQIKEHEAKLADPYGKGGIPKDAPPKVVEGIKNHWRKEIKAFQKGIRDIKDKAKRHRE